MRKATRPWRHNSVIGGLIVFLILLGLYSNGSPYQPSATSAYPIPGDVIFHGGIASGPYKFYLPVIKDDGTSGTMAPLATRSRYIGNDYLHDATDLGLYTAQNHPNGVVILDFGDPIIQNSSFGTYLPASTLFAPIDISNSNSDIKGFIQNYISGYCNALPLSSSRLTVLAGVNNYSNHTNTGLTQAHGQAWGYMIRDVNDWLLQSANVNCNVHVDVSAAMDIEMDWALYTPTRQWVDAYLSTAISVVNGYLVYWDFYNFGSCDGCPRNAAPSAVPNNGWTVDNIYQVSGGIARTRAIPQMYATSGVNAEQWYRISLNGATAYGYKIAFRGILSQEQACIDTNDLCTPANPGSTKASPITGWAFLQNQISIDPRTRLSNPIPWATNISWRQVNN